MTCIHISSNDLLPHFIKWPASPSGPGRQAPLRALHLPESLRRHLPPIIHVCVYIFIFSTPCPLSVIHVCVDIFIFSLFCPLPFIHVCAETAFPSFVLYLSYMYVQRQFFLFLPFPFLYIYHCCCGSSWVRLYLWIINVIKARKQFGLAFYVSCCSSTLTHHLWCCSSTLTL